jgi:tubulin polyglutamylase TTLL5
VSGQPGFFSQASSTAASGFYNNQNKNTSEFVHFKNISEKQIQAMQLPQAQYQKNFHIENSELLFKMIRFENKLVRGLLESHGFSNSESHEWNLLWSSCSCKSY